MTSLMTLMSLYYVDALVVRPCLFPVTRGTDTPGVSYMYYVPYVLFILEVYWYNITPSLPRTLMYKSYNKSYTTSGNNNINICRGCLMADSWPINYDGLNECWTNVGRMFAECWTHVDWVGRVGRYVGTMLFACWRCVDGVLTVMLILTGCWSIRR